MSSRPYKLKLRLIIVVLTQMIVLGATSLTPAFATSQGAAIVNAAASQSGVAYCGDGGNTSGPTHGSGGSGCGTGVVGFDCSGLALYAVYQGTGITLPHGHGMESAPGGQSETEANLQPGDLAFFGGGSLSNFEHVGVFEGSASMWDASDYNVPVQVHTLAWEENGANGLPFDGGVRYWITPTTPTTPTAITINGVLNVFKVGGDEQVYQNYWNSSINNWNGWTGLRGYTASNPAVIIRNGAMNLFIRGNDGQIYTEYDGSSGWSGWTSLGSHQMKGDPYVMLYGTSMNVFALDTSNVPYEDTQDSGGTWTGWGSNTNYMASDPVAVSYSGNLHLFYRGGDSKTYENVFNGNTWTGFSWVGQNASAVGNPTALSYSAEGELDLYFATTGGQIWKDTNIGSGWGTWTQMATGSMIGDPYIMAYNNDLQVFSRDTSNNIETRYWSYSGQSWSSWASLGGSSDSLASDPFAYQNGSSELDVYASDGSANTYHDTKIAPNNWGGFSELN